MARNVESLENKRSSKPSICPNRGKFRVKANFRLADGLGLASYDGRGNTRFFGQIMVLALAAHRSDSKAALRSRSWARVLESERTKIGNDAV